MTRFAPGMEEALAAQERWATDAEAAAFWAEGAPDVPTEDLTYPGAAGQPQPARLYKGTGPGLLLYIHGGGWVGGSIALNEPAARALAAESGWSVLSVSYRLAPAHPFPAGLEDIRAARAFAAPRGPFAMGGASAGANLALAAALADRKLDGLLLFYGVFGPATDTPTYRAFAEGPGLTRARMESLFAQYDPEGRRHEEPRIAPLLADLRGLPRTCLIAAQIDVLRHDSEALADRLAAAQVPASLHIEPGVTHGFINRARLVPAAAACLSRGARFLKSLPHHLG